MVEGTEGLSFKEMAICHSNVRKVIDKTGQITENSEYFKSISIGSGNYLNIVFNKNCKIAVISISAGNLTSAYTEYDVIADRNYAFAGTDVLIVDLGYTSSVGIIFVL